MKRDTTGIYLREIFDPYDGFCLFDAAMGLVKDDPTFPGNEYYTYILPVNGANQPFMTVFDPCSTTFSDNPKDFYTNYHCTLRAYAEKAQ